jgi:hypothetical protein
MEIRRQELMDFLEMLGGIKRGYYGGVQGVP